MASFISDLWESIFTPGPTPTLLVAANATFAALQVVLALLLAATYSVHFIVLSALSGALWWAINWFARELKAHQLQEEDKARRARETSGAPGLAATSDESETEVEAAGAATTSARRGKIGKAPRSMQAAASKEVEVEEETGELKHRAAAASPPAIPSPLGTKSSASTEDEWEKVSENEDKSK